MINLAIIPLGLLAGWLVNYLSDVLPATRRISQPACPQCGQVISILDYLLLRTCRSCGRTPSWRIYITQAILFLGTAYIWLVPPKSLNFWLAYILLVYLGVVFVIDLEHRVILHPVSLAGAVLGLIIGTVIHGISIALIGGAAGFGIMLLAYYLGEWFVRVRKVDDVALGFGDVNLSGVIGLMLGWPLILFGLLVAILLGGVFSALYVGFMLARKKYQAFSAIPYAPFLILSVIYVFYF
jgi:prepilin signal peptidase PulO-like enzyme (type II secretory pathway)